MSYMVVLQCPKGSVVSKFLSLSFKNTWLIPSVYNFLGLHAIPSHHYSWFSWYQLSLLLRLLAFSLVKQVKMLQIPFLYAFNICQMINKFFLFSGKIFKNRIVIQNWGRQMASLNFNLIINDHLYQFLKSYTLLKLFWCLSKNCNTMRA